MVEQNALQEEGDVSSRITKCAELKPGCESQSAHHSGDDHAPPVTPPALHQPPTTINLLPLPLAVKRDRETVEEHVRRQQPPAPRRDS